RKPTRKYFNEIGYRDYNSRLIDLRISELWEQDSNDPMECFNTLGRTCQSKLSGDTRLGVSKKTSINTTLILKWKVLCLPASTSKGTFWMRLVYSMNII